MHIAQYLNVPRSYMDKAYESVNQIKLILKLYLGPFDYFLTT